MLRPTPFIGTYERTVRIDPSKPIFTMVKIGFDTSVDSIHGHIRTNSFHRIGLSKPIFMMVRMGSDESAETVPL
jgi:hypothetical protein